MTIAEYEECFHALSKYSNAEKISKFEKDLDVFL